MERNLLPASLAALGLISLLFLLIDGGPAALAVTVILSLISLLVFRQFTSERHFVTVVFLAALALRLGFGIFVHVYDLREFFGGDANTYDFLGNEMMLRWTDTGGLPNPTVQWQLDNLGAGWGMYYLVGGIYYVFGRNILAAQSFCAVIGACTAPMVYLCTRRVYENERAARFATLLVALFPAFIIWSGQLLKDGPIIFLLVLTMTMVLELQRKFNWGALAVLVLSIAAVLPLRFYIFYMLAPAVAGSFIIGSYTSAQSMARNVVILVVLGLGLTYIGATRYAGTTLEQYGSLAQIQNARQDLSTSARSGFSSDVDVSTTGGALTTIPIGLIYLMLAPFPWQMGSLRSAITAPEIFAWWAMIPLMISGIAWTIKNRLRKAMAILLFSLMLTLSYSITQGNVGTAYRQRTQIQVFLFMFIAVGWTVRKEKQENKKILIQARQQALRSKVQAMREGVA